MQSTTCYQGCSVTKTYPKIIPSRPSDSENLFQLSWFMNVNVGNISTIVTLLLFVTTKLNQWNAERSRFHRITSDTNKGKVRSNGVRKEEGRETRKKEKKHFTLNYMIVCFYRSNW